MAGKKGWEMRGKGLGDGGSAFIVLRGGILVVGVRVGVVVVVAVVLEGELVVVTVVAGIYVGVGAGAGVSTLTMGMSGLGHRVGGCDCNCVCRADPVRDCERVEGFEDGAWLNRIPIWTVADVALELLGRWPLRKRGAGGSKSEGDGS